MDNASLDERIVDEWSRIDSRVDVISSNQDDESRAAQESSNRNRNIDIAIDFAFVEGHFEFDSNDLAFDPEFGPCSATSHLVA
jgi:hypothetical protein